MKNYKALMLFLGLFTFLNLNTLQAQFRILEPELEQNDNIEIGYSDEDLDLYGYNPPHKPIVGESPNKEFNFNYDFTDITMLIRLDAEMRAAYEAELNKWLGKQEDVFKNHINDILNSNYDNFKDAQKAFFTKRESNLIYDASNYISKSHKNEAIRIDKEQVNTTQQLVALDQCIFGDCGELGYLTIDGVPIRNLMVDLTGSAQYIQYQADRYERYKDIALSNFAQQEYNAAANTYWANEVYNLQFNAALRENYVNQHITNYGQNSQFNKVILMAAYLNQYVASGPIQVPNTMRIPVLWSNEDLLNIGKQKASSRFTLEELVFESNFISQQVNALLNVGNSQQAWSLQQNLLAIKDRVIKDHKNILKIDEFLNKHNNSIESINAGKEFHAILANGSPLQKSFALAVLDDNIDLALDILLDNATYVNYGNCPNPPCDIANEFTGIVAETVYYAVSDGIDAIINTLFMMYDMQGMAYNPVLTMHNEGKLIKKILIKSGIDVGDDVNVLDLAEIFNIKSRGQKISIEMASTDLLGLVTEAGITALDLTTLLSPGNGKTAHLLLAKIAGNRITAKTLSDFIKKYDVIANTFLKGGRGYKSFEAFKRAERYASPGNALHHIVEQNGFQSLNTLKFGNKNIHNTKNIIEIPTGKGTLHQKLTSHYQSKPLFTNGKTVREWLSDKSFQEQYDYGIKMLKEFGWDGVSGIIN
jgi:hypothetical protein